MLTLIQTADALRYRRMLDCSGRVNRLYAHLHGYRYLSFAGLKRGVAPICAVYNRAYMLRELLAEGCRDWVLYMDADAYVNDLAFDAVDYLRGHPGCAFVAAEAGAAFPEPWMINNGVFFIDLGHEAGRQIVQRYVAAIEASVPAAFWQNPGADWPPLAWDDQALLYGVLQSGDIVGALRKESGDFMNYHGSKLRQALRAFHPDFESREAALRQECQRVIDGFVQQVNRLLTPLP